MATLKAEEPNRNCLQELSSDLLSHGEFLLEWAYKLQWGDLSDSIVMDVGCGMVSFKLFKAVFPQFQKVIAIDKSWGYITCLKKLHDKIEQMEYCIADITNRSTLTEWEAKMAKITSFYCFNRLTDPRAGFANIHYMLRPGGEAIILMCLKNPLFICAKFLLEKPQWNMYQNLLERYPECQAHGAGLEFYELMLRELDFEIISCVEDLRVIIFQNEETFRASSLTKNTTITPHLPLNVQTEFRKQYAEALVQQSDKSSDGKLYLHTSTARIVIRRQSDEKK